MNQRGLGWFKNDKWLAAWMIFEEGGCRLWRPVQTDAEAEGHQNKHGLEESTPEFVKGYYITHTVKGWIYFVTR